MKIALVALVLYVRSDKREVRYIKKNNSVLEMGFIAVKRHPDHSYEKFNWGGLPTVSKDQFIINSTTQYNLGDDYTLLSPAAKASY